MNRSELRQALRDNTERMKRVGSVVTVECTECELETSAEFDEIHPRTSSGHSHCEDCGTMTFHEEMTEKPVYEVVLE